MTKEQLAQLLDGRERNDEIDKDEAAKAEAAGLVVLYGYSDDNVEFAGAIDQEIPTCDGDEIVLVDGKVFDFDACEHDHCNGCEYAQAAYDDARKRGKVIAVHFDSDGTWNFRTGIPHATFEVFDEGLLFCRGIVFDLSSTTQAVRLTSTITFGST